MSTSSFKRFVHALLVFAILVIVFEGAVTFIPDEIVSDVAQQTGLRLKNDRALDPGKLDVAILGDCFFFAGINPTILDQRLNVRSFNFAVNRVHTYLVSYLLLKNILKHAEEPPRLILLGVHASSLYYPLTMDLDVIRLAILPSFGMSADLFNELDFPLNVQVWWHQALRRIPSFEKQYLLKDDWPHLIKSFDRARHFGIKNFIAKNRGYFNEDLAKHPPKIRIGFDFPANEKIIQEYNDRYIRKILALAKEFGVKVIVVTNSYREDMLAHFKHNIKFDLEYYRGLQRIYPNIIGVLDMHSAVTDFDRYVDVVHLDGAGSALFTEDLVGRISRLDW